MLLFFNKSKCSTGTPKSNFVRGNKITKKALYLKKLFFKKFTRLFFGMAISCRDRFQRKNLVMTKKINRFLSVFKISIFVSNFWCKPKKKIITFTRIHNSCFCPKFKKQTITKPLAFTFDRFDILIEFL